MKKEISDLISKLEVARLKDKVGSLERLNQERTDAIQDLSSRVIKQNDTTLAAVDEKMKSFFAALSSIEERLNRLAALVPVVPAKPPSPYAAQDPFSKCSCDQCVRERRSLQRLPSLVP